MGYSRKNPNKQRGQFRIYFFENLPRNFWICHFTLLEIQEKTSFVTHCTKQNCAVCDTTLEIQGQTEAKTHGNSTWVFLEHSWKFHFFFNWPLEFLHAVSSEFFWNSLLRTVLSIRYFSGITSICHLVIDMWFDWENL